ncbi:MAG: extracellular solute-binding protein [Clostridiaceae bacterium]|nr:extracellular solute-binding protein [Clostridiaceae bacterium]
MSKKLIKTLALLLMFTIFLVTLAACGSSDSNNGVADNGVSENNAAGNNQSDDVSPDETPDSGKKVALTHWSGFTGPDRPYLEQLIEEFNETSPTTSIELSVMEWDILDQKLTASFATGTGPDFFSYGPEIMGKYNDMGALIDISEIYEGRVDISILPESVTEVPIFDGKTVASPMCVFGSMLYVNLDLLEDAGYTEPPSTQEELFEYAKNLVKKDDNGDVTQFGLFMDYTDVFQHFYWGHGLEAVDMDANKAIVNSEDGIALVERLKDLVLIDGVSPPTGDKATLFTSGKLAMYAQGPWDTTGAADAGINFDVVPIPGGPEAHMIPGHPIFYIPTIAIGDNIDHFYEWQEFWLSKESQAVWAAGTGYPAMRVDMADDPGLEGTWAAKFSQSADLFTVRNFATHKNSGRIFDEVLRNAWEAVVLEQGSVEEILNNAAVEIDGYLSE